MKNKFKYRLSIFLLGLFIMPTLYGQLNHSLPQDVTIDTTATLKSPGGLVYRLGLSFNELPIWGAQAFIFKHNQGTSFQKNLVWKESFIVIPFPDKSFEFSLAEVSNYLSNTYPNSIICSSEKVWFPKGDSLIPALKFNTCPGSKEGNRVVLFSALTRDVLFDESRLAFATQDTTVRATVFNPDPLTKAGVSYGAPYSDQNDGDIPELNAMRDTVLLQVTLENDTFYLKGDFIELKDIEPPFDIPVRQDNPDFFYTRAQQGFEDVTVYYHVQEFQKYIQSLGYTNLCNFPFWIDPHGMNGADNSYFSPGSNPFDGYISFGEGGVDDGEDADVIVHEYGHALSDAAAPSSNFGTERRGLDEGICDYFAAAYSKDLYNFKWNELYTWDGHNEFWAGRLADQDLIYPITSSNLYTFGSLWVTVMMEIRQALGANITDKLQLQALYLNVSNNTLPQAARNIILADTALFGGIHTPTLLNYFCQRHLISGAECNGINVSDLMKEDAVVIYPNPSTGQFTIAGYEGDWKVFDITGMELLSGKGSVVNLHDFPSGLFTLKVGKTIYKLIRIN